MPLCFMVGIVEDIMLVASYVLRRHYPLAQKNEEGCLYYTLKVICKQIHAGTNAIEHVGRPLQTSCQHTKMLWIILWTVLNSWPMN